MKIAIRCDKSATKTTIEKIKRAAKSMGGRLPHAEYDAHAGTMMLDVDSGASQHATRALISKVEKIPGVSGTRIIRKKVEDTVQRKNRHIFFDIDSTLTHGGVSSINPGIKAAFCDMLKTNHDVYFCTGRSADTVAKLVDDYELGHSRSIAEGGGIILGINGKYKKHGDSRPAKKLLAHLNRRKIPHQMDPKQKSRITEVVLIKRSIKKETLKREAKKIGAEVEIHTSKDSHHISKKGVNKGTAIHYLVDNELDLDPEYDETIAVGDSRLDEPMFDHCDKCFTVRGATVRPKYKRKCPSLGPAGLGAVCRLRNKLVGRPKRALRRRPPSRQRA